MKFTIEYIFINPELDEIKNIKNKTIKDYIKKYGNSYWKNWIIIIIFDFLIK